MLAQHFGWSCIRKRWQAVQKSIQILGRNTPKLFEYFFQAAVQAVDCIEMVYFVIVCMAIQYNLNTLLFCNQMIICRCTITLKDTAFTDTAANSILDIFRNLFL